MTRQDDVSALVGRLRERAKASESYLNWITDKDQAMLEAAAAYHAAIFTALSAIAAQK